MAEGPGAGARVRGAAWLPGLGVLALALLPTLTALLAVRWFVTQDGPAHLYNAHILAESFRPDSPFRSSFEVRWQPFPNWAGHIALMGLLEFLPPVAADRAMMAITLVGLAGATLWLRRRVAGDHGLGLAALWSALLALNVGWLYGFYGFLLGAIFFPITLGIWWSGFEHLSWGRVAALGGLLVVGYFCHPVSLGLTVIGLVVLAILTPGPGRLGRLAKTSAGLAPLGPLLVAYRWASRGRGPMVPTWYPFRFPASPRSWGGALGWVDPLTLEAAAVAPSPGSLLSVRSLWLLLAVAALAVVAKGWARAGRSVRRGWAALAALILIGGLLGPDSMGQEHGDFLPQRALLLGLVVLAPVLPSGGPRAIRLGVAAVLVAMIAVQTALVWDYARRSDHRVGELVRAATGPVGRRNRVAMLLLRRESRFRADPVYHADCLLGVGTGNVVWTNYEPAYYVFPVQYRRGLPHPSVFAFEEISSQDDPARRASDWAMLLEQDHFTLDRLVLDGDDPTLDPITARWFEPIARSGPVSVWRHRAVSR